MYNNSVPAIEWWQYGVCLLAILAFWPWKPIGREPPSLRQEDIDREADPEIREAMQRLLEGQG